MIASWALLLAAAAGAAPPWEGGPAYYARWRNGPPARADFFPIAVWLQDPAHAEEYKKIGINMFVGLWKGPTEEQLRLLSASKMLVLASANEVGRSSPNRGVIRGWMLMDEPDNAQPKPGGGWGPCVLPPVIQEQYRRLKAADPTRPVYLNLGQAVIHEKWPGRGEYCSPHREHYPAYIDGADIVSYDVYPVNNKLPLWWVAAGIDRLRRWAGYRKPVWNWIETTSISGGPKPTPADIQAEVWLSIIHGSRGIGYFCHQFKPVEDDAAPLHDAETRQALAAINARLTGLARALNQPPEADAVTVASSNPNLPIDTMVKRLDGETYVFAIGSRPEGETTAGFALRGCAAARATVLDESRTLPVKGGVFHDRFRDYQVHIYRLRCGG